MYESIQGNIKNIAPTHVILVNSGIGYYIHISLNCYTAIQAKETADLYIHQVIREDAHLLYGFFSEEERNVFRKLISVSGVGASIARIILSSMTVDEIKIAITSGNVDVLKSVKGIGIKSAQRIIVDLKDKIDIDADTAHLITTTNNTIKYDALSALETLGFNKKQAEKVITKILSAKPEIQVEDLIKQSLKQL